MDSLQEFAMAPAHLEATRQYSRWHEAYHIVISEVLRSYGDGRMPHVTATE